MTDGMQSENLTGRRIGGYEILETIGQGGMATVYRAQQVSMKRVVALKVLPRQFLQDDTYLQRFHREVEIVAQLEHRNIVPVHDFGEHDGQPYIVMRYMPAGSVDSLLTNGPLEIELVLKIIEQIAPALDYAHTKQVLHRDLKPSNILMDENGDSYLTDFGIARVLGENQGGINITTHNVVGTPAYMSPEQAQGKPLDSRSDVYALGVMLFEMCTGQRPFQADTPYGIAVLQVTAPTPSARSVNRNVPLRVEKVIERAMNKKVDDRYRSAVLLAEALSSAVNPQASSVNDTQPGMARPTRPVPVRQPPAAIPQPPAQTGTSMPQPYRQPQTPPRSRSAPPPAAKSRRKRPQNLWLSAAIGGLIGCGLLTVLVIIIALVVSNTANATITDTPGIVLTLDPTSDAARDALLGSDPTPFR